MSKDDNDASMADNNNHNSEHEDESEGQGMQPGDEEDILLGGMPKIVVVSISSPLLSGWVSGFYLHTVGGGWYDMDFANMHTYIDGSSSLLRTDWSTWLTKRMEI